MPSCPAQQGVNSGRGDVQPAGDVAAAELPELLQDDQNFGFADSPLDRTDSSAGKIRAPPAGAGRAQIETEKRGPAPVKRAFPGNEGRG